ncbi:MAG: alpha/beta hydrolase [Acetobacteraceae bacterium]
MPALHPDAVRLLELVRAAGRVPFHQLSPKDARLAYAAGRAVLQPPPAEVAETRDVDIPGKGGTLPLRLYRGIGTAPDHPLPGLLYLHGGGWVLGSVDSHDGVCRRLANAAACRVISVDYRLAPEHPYPAAVDDAATALDWVAANAAAIGVDPARLAVGGDSAGGNLAAVLALLARDGQAPPLAAQLLLYPATDFAMDTGSYAAMTEGLPLTADTMRWFIDHYAPDPAARTEWRASPGRAASLRGTAPAFVLTAGHDPLADEGHAYAARLEADGVPVTTLHLSGHVHGFLTMGAVVAAAAEVADFAGRSLVEWFKVGAPS